MCFFLQSHMRTVFCIMIQAPARYRILFFTGGDKEGRRGGREGSREGKRRGEREGKKSREGK